MHVQVKLFAVSTPDKHFAIEFKLKQSRISFDSMSDTFFILHPQAVMSPNNNEVRDFS